MRTKLVNGLHRPDTRNTPYAMPYLASLLLSSFLLGSTAIASENNLGDITSLFPNTTNLAGETSTNLAPKVPMLDNPNLDSWHQAGQTGGSEGSQPANNYLWRPGKVLSNSTDTNDLVPTDNVELARQQVRAYPDNAEASFILAVALTRTPYVEEALREVRRAKKLAVAQGGPHYFDQMINSYENMLTYTPKDNRVRYGLAWAYYMKAYLLAENSERQMRATQNPLEQIQAAKSRKATSLLNSLVSVAGFITSNGKSTNGLSSVAGFLPQTNFTGGILPHIPAAIEKATPSAIPEVRYYYELALKKMDEVLISQPKDVWTLVYRARLRYEHTGNLAEAMATWNYVRSMAPRNPAPYFFLSDGYLKQGNIPNSVSYASRALELRVNNNWHSTPLLY